MYIVKNTTLICYERHACN